MQLRRCWPSSPSMHTTTSTGEGPPRTLGSGQVPARTKVERNRWSTQQTQGALLQEDRPVAVSSKHVGLAAGSRLQHLPHCHINRSAHPCGDCGMHPRHLTPASTLLPLIPAPPFHLPPPQGHQARQPAPQPQRPRQAERLWAVQARGRVLPAHAAGGGGVHGRQRPAPRAHQQQQDAGGRLRAYGGLHA
jgi:hypothetical protein